MPDGYSDESPWGGEQVPGEVCLQSGRARTSLQYVLRLFQICLFFLVVWGISRKLGLISCSVSFDKKKFGKRTTSNLQWTFWIKLPDLQHASEDTRKLAALTSLCSHLLPVFSHSVNKYLTLLCAQPFLSTEDMALSKIHKALLSWALHLWVLGPTSTQINGQTISDSNLYFEKK